MKHLLQLVDSALKFHINSGVVTVENDTKFAHVVVKSTSPAIENKIKEQINSLKSKNVQVIHYTEHRYILGILETAEQLQEFAQRNLESYTKKMLELKQQELAIMEEFSTSLEILTGIKKENNFTIKLSN